MTYPGIEHATGVMMSHDDRKRRRCFHRVISGIERWGVRDLRFITLTSSPGSPLNIQYSFRRLLGYLRRAGKVKAYVKCLELTKSGLQHLHVLYAGKFIPQICLSALWAHIHGAPVVHIEAAYGRKVGVAGYLAKYMAKASLNGRGYSWSWGWCHLGISRTWRWFRRGASAEHVSFSSLLDAWHYHIRAVRFLESWHGLPVGHLRVLTDGGIMVYVCGEMSVSGTFCEVLAMSQRGVSDVSARN